MKKGICRTEASIIIGTKLCKTERICFSVQSQYRDRLYFWKEHFAPNTPEEEWRDQFCGALDRLTGVEHLMDVLLHSPLEERGDPLLSAGKEIAGYAGRLQESEAGTVESSENGS